MADDLHDTIDKAEPPVSRGRTALSTPLLGIVLGIIGAVAMWFSFVNGISAALNGSGDGATPFIIVFIGAGVLALIAILIGIVGLVRGGHRILSFLSLLAGLIPVLSVVLLYIVQSATT
jgi:hypothetical protein